jgi:hypothetical protein
MIAAPKFDAQEIVESLLPLVSLLHLVQAPSLLDRKLRLKHSPYNLPAIMPCLTLLDVPRRKIPFVGVTRYPRPLALENELPRLQPDL